MIIARYKRRLAQCKDRRLHSRKPGSGPIDGHPLLWRALNLWAKRNEEKEIGLMMNLPKLDKPLLLMEVPGWVRRREAKGKINPTHRAYPTPRKLSFLVLGGRRPGGQKRENQ